MSDSLREQRPLLEEFSDEELHPSHFCPQRRYPKSLRGRARNKIKGAAAIITRWPEHWSSSVLFWWIVVSMFLLTVMVIYNTIVALVLIPSTYSFPIATESNNAPDDTRPQVNMHVFIEEDEIVDLKHYLPYINKLTDKYEDFNYNFIVLLNDSTADVTKKIDEQNNINAMNDVLAENYITRRDLADVGALNIRHVLLSDYLNSSPLKNRWRLIPAQFIPFIVRVVSLWENGGIAIDPLILTPHTPNTIYYNRLQDTLKDFNKNKQHNKVTADKEAVKPKHHVIPKKTVNNIQDIIDDSDSNDINTESKLSEAEDQESEVAATKISNEKTISRKSRSSELNVTKVNENIDSKNKDKQDKERSSNLISSKNLLMPPYFHQEQNENNNAEQSYRPIIVLPDDDGKKRINVHKTTSKVADSEKLVIDLNGNFLATKTGCHAFFGTVFNDVVHSSDSESVSGLIIQELSKFCNGVLSACKGIDVILVS